MTPPTALRRARSRQVRQMPIHGFETRDSGDGSVTFSGYASTFDQPYDMGWFSEVVRSGAFSKTLSESPDVRFLINHGGLPLARTRSGTLDLAQDTTGLLVSAQLDTTDPDVQSIVPKMKRGDLDQMSFGFRIVQESWSPDYSQCDLLELALDGGDVSLVTYPANPNTSAAIRSALGRNKAKPETVRALYRELREGKVLSAANVAILEGILEALGNLDNAFDAATGELDTATDALNSLLDDPSSSPDPDDSTDPDTDPDDESDADDEPEAGASARTLSLSMAKAIRDAALLRQH